MFNSTPLVDTPENAIMLEVARIKRDHPYKGDYREQIAELLGVLFLKFGERVGAGRIVALMSENGKSPSTSTVQSEINKFWENVRASTALKIVRPDVPPFLQEFIGEMAAAMWEKSMQAASATFQDEREEYEAHLAEGSSREATATALSAFAQAEGASAKMQLEQAESTVERLLAELTAERTGRHAAEANAQELEIQLNVEKSLRKEEADLRQATLLELRTAVERTAAEHKRLMAIGDDYKQQAARDRAGRESAEKARQALAAENAALHAQLQELLQSNGVLSGTVEAQAARLESLGRPVTQSPGDWVTGRTRRPSLRVRLK